MLHPPTANGARISEIFSSLQGEGLSLGQRHLFIRFEECHIHCEYCDELDKPAAALTLEKVMEKILQLKSEEGPHSFVSLTGGEPLLYLNFLKTLLLRLKAGGFHTHLETNGILWQALEEVIGWCDWIAMDLKPASVTKERNFFVEHRHFLEIARTKQVFIKIVLSRAIDVQEFHDLVRIVQEIAPETPVFLQPASRPGEEGHEDSQLMSLLGELQRMALRMIPDVRIAPRLHRLLKIR